MLPYPSLMQRWFSILLFHDPFAITLIIGKNKQFHVIVYFCFAFDRANKKGYGLCFQDKPQVELKFQISQC
jgi:hypothetical protein